MSVEIVEAKTLRVVIVDDTADLRELLRFALIRGGMSVVGEAGDGLAGIDVVRAVQPDVVLLDLSMPIMDGLEALPQIRAAAPGARVIILSGFGATQMAERALDIGADGYLQKGASLGNILDQIRDIVGGRSDRPAMATTGPAAEPIARTTPTPPVTPSSQWDAFSLAPYGIIEVEAEQPYRMVRVNAAARVLIPDDAQVGEPFSEVAPELANAIANIRLAGDGELEATFGDVPIVVSLRHTGTTLLLYLQPITNEVGHLRNAIATTAHEIRGPVSVLCAITETILEDELDPDQIDRLMASTLRQARLLDNITGDLLVAAQLQRGTLRIDTQQIDPAAVCRSVMEDHRIGADMIEVLDERAVMADPLRLQQMLGNLISNAFKYGRPPVQLRVRPSPDHERWVCLDVIDHGTGIPVQFESQLFREYTRASGTSALGTGLGLHVVSSLARRQGGTASYAPQATGGSVFTISLPAATTR